jgi:hypothetical protein
VHKQSLLSSLHVPFHYFVDFVVLSSPSLSSLLAHADAACAAAAAAASCSWGWGLESAMCTYDFFRCTSYENFTQPGRKANKV